MTVISKYAYKAVWDATELSKGLMNTRALFVAQKKIVEDSRTPFDRLAIGQENLNKLIEKYPDLASRKLHLEKQLEKQYLLEESAVRKLDAAERQRLNTLLTTAEKQERAAARMEKARARVEKRYRTFDESSDNERLKAGMSAGPNWAAKSAGSPSAAAGIGLGRVGAVGLAAGIAYKAFDVAKETISVGIDANRAVERAEVTFEHFTGSGNKAADMMAKLRAMSSETGVSFKSLSQGAAQMMQRGFDGDESIKRMGQLAEVTGGVPEKMDRLAIAFSQIKSKGRLTAEELEQLNEAGFSPMKELMEITSLDGAELRKEMEKGNISWELAAKALDKATDAGGRYHGFLEKFKGTSTGAAQESAAAWEDAYSRIGKAWEPIEKAWNKASSFVAREIGSLADGVTAREELPAIDAKAERIKKHEQERAALFAANKKREQEALAAIDARNREQATSAMGGLQDRQFDQMKQLVPDDELKKFERVFQLLTDYNKEQAKLEAIENFKSGMGLGDFSHMLGEEAKAEMKKTQELEKQVELRKRQQDIIDKSKQIAENFASEEQKQVDALAELELARRYGGLSQTDFERESKKVVATEARGNGLASSIRAGSAEAYQFMAGVQDRGQREKMQEKQESKQLQERMIKAIEKVEAAVKDTEGLSAAG